MAGRPAGSLLTSTADGLLADAVPSDVIIRTEALTKVFSDRNRSLTAVDELDLEVGEGEVFGLLGPNGAGKTTTIGMLTTRVVPTSGRAVVAGVDVMSSPTRTKQVIGVVSQSNSLDRSLSVWENLYFHGRYFGMGAKVARRVADDLLERFGLADRATADVGTLSGGMAKRVMLARALAHRPPILFLDEPTAGLDPQSRWALWEIVGELHRAGHTVMLTTHYMEEADRLSGRVAIMDRGRLLALDSPSGLKRSVDADTVVRVAVDGDLAGLARLLETLAGTQSVRLLDGVVQVTLRGMTGVAPRILSHAGSAGFVVTDLSVTEPTLETVFMQLTGKDLRE